MDKPIQLILEEIKTNMANTINSAQIPMCMITPLIKEIYEQCCLVERQQYEQAKQQYEKSQNDGKEK